MAEISKEHLVSARNIGADIVIMDRNIIDTSILIAAESMESFQKNY